MDHIVQKEQSVRDASTIVLVRRDLDQIKILMGQRRASAAFMPNKFVFPGGSLDALDFKVPVSHSLNQHEEELLSKMSFARIGEALGVAAVRELWEETGLLIGLPYQWENEIMIGWERFQEDKIAPNLEPLKFFFRAITPKGRPRRFDARFFLCEACEIIGCLDDFSSASTELSHLQWISLSDVEKFDLPRITKIVLKEVKNILRNGPNPLGIPFHYNDTSGSKLTYIVI